MALHQSFKGTLICLRPAVKARLKSPLPTVFRLRIATSSWNWTVSIRAPLALESRSSRVFWARRFDNSNTLFLAWSLFDQEGLPDGLLPEVVKQPLEFTGLCKYAAGRGAQPVNSLGQKTEGRRKRLEKPAFVLILCRIELHFDYVKPDIAAGARLTGCRLTAAPLLANLPGLGLQIVFKKGDGFHIVSLNGSG